MLRRRDHGERRIILQAYVVTDEVAHIPGHYVDGLRAGRRHLYAEIDRLDDQAVVSRVAIRVRVSRVVVTIYVHVHGEGRYRWVVPGFCTAVSACVDDA